MGSGVVWSSRKLDGYIEHGALQIHIHIFSNIDTHRHTKAWLATTKYQLNVKPTKKKKNKTIET